MDHEHAAARKDNLRHLIPFFVARRRSRSTAPHPHHLDNRRVNKYLGVQMLHLTHSTAGTKRLAEFPEAGEALTLPEQPTPRPMRFRLRGRVSPPGQGVTAGRVGDRGYREFALWRLPGARQVYEPAA
jgi:hypothetical protein